DRGGRYLGVFGRLRPGTPLEQAHAEISAIGERQAHDFPLTNGGRRLRAVTLVRGVTEDDTIVFIWVITAAGAFALPLACATVACMLRARAEGRRREMAVRAALGAGRGRIVRQLLTESLLLSFIAAACSLLLSAWGTDFIRAAIPPSITRYIAGWDRIG